MKWLIIIFIASWSAKHGPHPAGDPVLHYYVGELLFKGAPDLQEVYPMLKDASFM
jgi:hypothetical protein